MDKNQDQSELKKKGLVQCFNSLVISAIPNRKTEMLLKCSSMNRYFVLFCGSANTLVSGESLGPEAWHVCCGAAALLGLKPELDLAPPGEQFLGFVLTENCNNPPKLLQE